MSLKNINKKIEEGIKKLVLEKSKSKSQQRLFGLAQSVKKGGTPRSEVSKAVLDISDKVSGKDIEDFASTKHKGLPEKVKKDVDEELQIDEESGIPILNLDDVNLGEEND